MKNSRKYFLLLMIFFVSVTSKAQSTTGETTQFSLYGFGRTTLTWDNQDLGRSDLFIPANIQVDAPKNPNFFIGAKQTRLGFDVTHKLGDETVSIKLEGDFHNDGSDANGLFRMRLAFVKYKFILIGMEYSNFFDEEVNPSTVDFEGPSSSTFSRTPQVRFSTYKSKNVLSLSFENPTEKLTLGGNIKALSERFPDVVGAYRFTGTFGFVKVAALFREIRYQSDEARSLFGYGATVMTSLNVGANDKIKFQGVIGTGISKYMQGISGLGYEGIYNGTNKLEALSTAGLNLSYKHYWKENVNSSIVAGYVNVENNKNLMPLNYQSGFYGSLNLFWDAVKNLTFGVETLVGKRINVNDSSGNALRFNMNATYKFNKIF